MKKIAIILTCTALLFTTISKVSAVNYNRSTEQIDMEDLYVDIKELSNSYKNGAINSEQLMELMAITPKEDVSTKVKGLNGVEDYFKQNPTKLFNPANYNLEQTVQTRDGDMYDGNPPYSDAEQISRLQYITGILDKEYSNPKYNRGLYTTYLYTSHYVENVTFDRTQSNEKNFGYPVLANIICANDIIAFNEFYRITQGSAIVDNFTSFIDGMLNINNSGLTTALAKETIKMTTENVDGELGLYIEEMNNLGIIDSKSMVETSNQLFASYKRVVTNDYSDVNGMIDDIYDGLGGGLSHKLVKHYVTSVRHLSSSLLATSIVSPILGGVIYFTDTLCNFVPTLGLAGLYYGGHIRQADRFAIYVGLRPRP